MFRPVYYLRSVKVDISALQGQEIKRYNILPLQGGAEYRLPWARAFPKLVYSVIMSPLPLGEG